MKPVLRSNIFTMIVIILIGFGSIFVAQVIDYFQLSTQYSIVYNEVLFLVLPSILYLLIFRLPVKKTLKLNFPGFPAIMISLLIGILIYPMSLFLANLSQLFFHNYLQDAFVAMQSMPFIAFIVTIAVTPAICEELVMRGVLFSGYTNIPIKKAALMNGLFFGIIHLNLQQFFYAFVIGVIFAYMVDATKSLYSSMIAHFTCNGISALISYFLLRFLANNTSVDMGGIASLPLGLQILSLVIQFFIFAVCLICICLLIKALYSICQNKAVDQKRDGHLETSPEDEGALAEPVERVFNWPVYVTLVVFAIYLVLLRIAV